MLLPHRVVNGDEMLVLHVLNGNGMGIVCLFCLQSRKCDAAAADYRIPQCVDGVSADRTDIESGTKHIGIEWKASNLCESAWLR